MFGCNLVILIAKLIESQDIFMNDTAFVAFLSFHQHYLVYALHYTK